MINFKNIALSAALAAGSLFGGMAPAEAGTCWFEAGNSGRLAPSYCQTTTRVNANGHNVVDVIDHQGTKITLVFWYENSGDRRGQVEVIHAGSVYNGTWYTDRQGDYRLVLGNSEMAIRI